MFKQFFLETELLLESFIHLCAVLNEFLKIDSSLAELLTLEPAIFDRLVGCPYLTVQTVIEADLLLDFSSFSTVLRL